MKSPGFYALLNDAEANDVQPRLSFIIQRLTAYHVKLNDIQPI